MEKHLGDVRMCFENKRKTGALQTHLIARAHSRDA